MKSQDIIMNSFTNSLGVISGMTLSNRDFLSLTQFDDISQYLIARKKVQQQLLWDMNLKDMTSISPVQVHGNHIEHIEKKIANKEEKQNYHVEADGLYTFDSAILLGVGVADCAGIVLYDAKGDFMAVLHSGWRGTVGACVSGIEKKSRSIVRTCMEDVVQSYGVNMQNLHIWISPCAKSCCYEIGEEIVPLFMDYPKSIVKKNNKVYADISIYIYEELQELGVNPSQIMRDERCTICDESFHSHRRDGAKSGRAMVFVGR